MSKYSYYISFENNSYEFTPANSGDIEYKIEQIEEPIYDKYLKLNTDIVITKGGVSSQLFNLISVNAINQLYKKIFITIYENESIIYEGFFSGTSIAVDNDHYRYTISPTEVNRYSNLLKNFDTSIDIIRDFNSNEITVDAPALYSGDIQGCYLLKDILISIFIKYVDDISFIDSGILIDEANDITGSSNKYRKIAITQSSNLIEAVDNSTYEKATSFKLTIRELLVSIYRMFEIMCYVEDDTVYFKNKTEIRAGSIDDEVVINLTELAEGKYFRSKNNYTINDVEIPERETLSYSEYHYERFSDASIVYDLGELEPKSSAEKQYSIKAITDIYGVYLNPEKFSRDTFAILQLNPDVEGNECIETAVEDGSYYSTSFQKAFGNFDLSVESSYQSNSFFVDFNQNFGNENYISVYSLNEFAVVSGDTITLSGRILEKFLSTYGGLAYGYSWETMQSYRAFRISMYIGDGSFIDDGLEPDVISNVITLDNENKSIITEYPPFSIPPPDGIVKMSGSFNNKRLTANSTTPKGVLVFKIYRGYYKHTGGNGRDANAYSQSIDLTDLSYFLVQNVTLQNYDLRPSNLLRTFYQSGRYLTEGRIFSKNPEDNGDFTAIDTIKIKQGDTFKVPVDNIFDFNFNGFVVSEIGNDGEIADATYNSHTHMLEVTPIYDKTKKGGSDILAFDFDGKVGVETINYDSKTVTATISASEDVFNVQNVSVKLSYKANLYLIPSNYSVPRRLNVYSDSGNLTQWTVYLVQESMLSINIYSENFSPINLFDVVNSDASTGVMSSLLITPNVQNLNTLNASASDGIVNYSSTSASLINSIQAYINQEIIDLSLFDNLLDVDFTNQYAQILLTEIIFSNQSLDSLIAPNHELLRLEDIGFEDSSTVDISNNSFNSYNLEKALGLMNENGGSSMTVDLRDNSPAQHRVYNDSVVIDFGGSGLGGTDYSVGERLTSKDGSGIILEVTSVSSGVITGVKLVSEGSDVFVNGGKYNYLELDGVDDGFDVSFAPAFLKNRTYEMRMRFRSTSARQLTGCGGFYDTLPNQESCYIGVENGKWVFAVGSTEVATADADTDYHVFKINNGQLFIDDQLIYDLSANSVTDGAFFDVGFVQYGSSSLLFLYAGIDFVYLKEDSTRSIVYADNTGDFKRYVQSLGALQDIANDGSGLINVAEVGFDSDGTGEFAEFSFETHLSNMLDNKSCNVKIEIYE